MSSKLLPYEWMIKPTPQSDWIDGKGALLWLAFFFTEVGAGIYMVSLFLNYRPGWLIGWLVSMVLGGFTHLFYLGNPSRVWRIFFNARTSELSRGMWATFLFGGLGFLQIVPVVLSFLPWTGSHIVLRVIMGILCVMLITHGFLTMNVVKALPVWNSSMMIPLSITSGLWVGSQAIEFIMSMSGVNIGLAEILSRWFLLSYMFIMFLFFFSTSHTSEMSALSIKEMLKGELAARTYFGVMLVGIVIPLIITLFYWKFGGSTESLGSGIIFVRLLCVFIGDLMLRNNIMRSARYAPII